MARIQHSLCGQCWNGGWIEENVQSFPSHHAERFFGLLVRISPGLWAATAASYCLSRAGNSLEIIRKTSLHDGMGNSVDGCEQFVTPFTLLYRLSPSSETCRQVKNCFPGALYRGPICPVVGFFLPSGRWSAAEQWSTAQYRSDRVKRQNFGLILWVHGLYFYSNHAQVLLCLDCLAETRQQ